MNTLRVPYEARTRAAGYASEGSACLREAASAKAGPTKHEQEPRLRAATHFGVQAWALARGAPLFAEVLSMTLLRTTLCGMAGTRSRKAGFLDMYP